MKKYTILSFLIFIFFINRQSYAMQEQSDVDLSDNANFSYKEVLEKNPYYKSYFLEFVLGKHDKLKFKLQLLPPYLKAKLLLTASTLNNVKFAQFILDCCDKASYIHANEYHITPLHVACFDNNNELAKILLDYEAPVNAIAFPAGTPLHASVVKSNIELVKLLLRHKADPNIKTPDTGQTPLHIALKKGDSEIAQLLLTQRSRISVRDNDNNSALHYACMGKNEKAVELILNQNKALIKAKSKDNITPLHCACISDKQSVIEQILQAGAPVYVKTRAGDTPLHFAVKAKSIIAVSTIIDHISNSNSLDKHNLINAKSNRDFTPLRLALMLKQKEIAKLLLKAGADMPSIDPTKTSSEAIVSSEAAQEQHNKNSSDTYTVVEDQAPLQQPASQETDSLPNKKEEPTDENIIEKPARTTQINKLNNLVNEETLPKVQPEAAETITQIEIPEKITIDDPAQKLPANNQSKLLKKQDFLKEKQATSPPLFTVLIDSRLSWPKPLQKNIQEKERFIEHLQELKHWPNVQNVETLKIDRNTKRFKYGIYRALFTINKATKEILIRSIESRKDVYKQLSKKTKSFK